MVGFRKISKPYDNPFLEKSNYGRERESERERERKKEREKMPLIVVT